MIRTYRNNAAPEFRLSVYNLVLLCLLLVSGSSIFANEKYKCQRPINETVITVKYMERGGFCEGLYREPYSGALKEEIQVLGYHANQIVTEDSTDPLNVYVHNPTDHEALFLITETAENVFYQYDRKLAQGTQKFEWSTSLIRHTKVQLGARDLVAYACLSSCGKQKAELVPVSIGPKIPNQFKPFVVIKLPTNSKTFTYELVDQENEKTIHKSKKIKVNQTKLNIPLASMVGVNKATLILSAELYSGYAISKNVQLHGVEFEEN